MALPKELANYASEDDFIQRFLIPLLKRLGFSVVNYHGTREHGRDLIFAEIDRFGHVRYHGLQAKYVESLGLAAMQPVIDDCQQAFAVPFTHPHTGATEYLSTFYAVNGGSISDDARERYFGYLKPRHGDNAKLIDGKSLIVLDRWAAISRGGEVSAALQSLLVELRFNATMSPKVAVIATQYIQDDQSVVLPLERFREIAVSEYIARPSAPQRIDPAIVLEYSQFIKEINSGLEHCLMPFIGKDVKKEVLTCILQRLARIEAMAVSLAENINGVLADLAPITGL